MKLLITGGLGFIGSHLVDSLSKKDNIRNSPNIQIEKIDLVNFKRLGQIIEKFKPNTIIHLAGNTSHSKSFEEPLKDVESNAKTTLFMLEKIRELGLPCKFILGSTFIVIGKPKKLPVTENTPCNPTTIYGTNRLASEHYCKIYHDVYGINTVVFRITNSFGPREQIIPGKNAVNYLIHNAFKGNTVTIYNRGKFFRDLIYISDVISGIRTIMRKGKPGEVYWISSGKKTWFYELSNLLQKLTNCKVKFVTTPRYTKKTDVGNFVVDNSKLRKLGWVPKTPVEIGIKKTLTFFDSN